MKRLVIIALGIILTGCIVEVQKPPVEIGGAPDVLIHETPRGRICTFTFEQDGHKFMVANSYHGVAMVEIKD